MSGRPPTNARKRPPAAAAWIFPANARGRSCARDFARFDLLLAMDGSNQAELERLALPEQRAKIRRFLDFAPHLETRDVPDPFFGGGDEFDHALDLIEEAARGLLATLLERSGLPASAAPRHERAASGLERVGGLDDVRPAAHGIARREQHEAA